MAKSLRSKIKRRYRKAKRHYVEENIVADRVNVCYKKVQNMLCGLPVDQPRLKNAFLYPEDPEAAFPKIEKQKVIDFRSDALPLSGYAASGCRRKYDDMEKIQLGLVVHSLDGCLELEKRMLLEHQQISVPVDVSMNDMVKNIKETSSEEMESLLMSVTDVNLMQARTNNPNAPTDSMDMLKGMRHRTKHTTAEVPLLKNTLKLIKKKR